MNHVLFMASDVGWDGGILAQNLRSKTTDDMDVFGRSESRPRIEFSDFG